MTIGRLLLGARLRLGDANHPARSRTDKGNDIMRKTALILAGAAMFDLGVVVVSVQAQESSRPSPGAVATAPGATPNRDHIDQDAQITACANGKHIPNAPLSACRATPPESSGPAGQTRAVDMFLKIDADFTARACASRRGAVVRHEGVQQCRLPAEPGNTGARPSRR